MYEPVYIERFIIDEEVAFERVAHCQLGVLRFSYAKLSATLMLNHATAVGMPRQQQTVAYGNMSAVIVSARNSWLCCSASFPIDFSKAA